MKETSIPFSVNIKIAESDFYNTHYEERYRKYSTEYFMFVLESAENSPYVLYDLEVLPGYLSENTRQLLVDYSFLLFDMLDSLQMDLDRHHEFKHKEYDILLLCNLVTERCYSIDGEEYDAYVECEKVLRISGR